MLLVLILATRLAILPIPFFNSPGSLAKVATPTIGESDNCAAAFPCNGCDYTITLTTATTGAHLFYTKDGTAPTHTGDTATGTTTRIGLNSGTFGGHIPRGGSKIFTVVCIGYQSGMTDSDPASASEDIECPTNQ